METVMTFRRPMLRHLSDAESPTQSVKLANEKAFSSLGFSSVLSS